MEEGRGTFRQGDGKEGEGWPDENDAAQRLFTEEGGGVVTDVLHRRQKKLKVSTLWV